MSCSFLPKAACLASTLLLLSGLNPAGAITLSVDLDPVAAGIQSALTVSPLGSFIADVVISGIDTATTNLQGFEFDLDFNPAILSATLVTEGNFLFGEFGTFIIEEDFAPPDVNFAVVALGTSTHGASGVLASIGFNVIGTGAVTLSLHDVLLADSSIPANEILVTTLNTAAVTVSTNPPPPPPNPSPVPAPPTVLLLALGLAGLWSSRLKSKAPY
ncbi:MAG: cohesin domain-containing protein [Candidatus Competibacteraceae bacterium]